MKTQTNLETKADKVATWEEKAAENVKGQGCASLEMLAREANVVRWQHHVPVEMTVALTCTICGLKRGLKKAEV